MLTVEFLLENVFLIIELPLSQFSDFLVVKYWEKEYYCHLTCGGPLCQSVWMSFGGNTSSLCCQVFSSFSSDESFSVVFWFPLTSSYFPLQWGWGDFSLLRTTIVRRKLRSAPPTNTAIRPRNLHTWAHTHAHTHDHRFYSEKSLLVKDFRISEFAIWTCSRFLIKVVDFPTIVCFWGQALGFWEAYATEISHNISLNVNFMAC